MLGDTRGYLLRAQAEPAVEQLADQFTEDELVRIERMRLQVLLYPDAFQLDLSVRRLVFARWLVLHGYLDEGEGMRDTDQGDGVR